MSFKHLMPPALKSTIKIARAEGFRAFGSDRFAWPALNSLDREVVRRLPPRGTFLEIGANDGYSQSNTYHLEKFGGWQGILIEPLPRMYRICRVHRRRSRCFNVACVGPKGPSSVSLVDGGLMAVAPDLITDIGEKEHRVSGVQRTVEAVTATLSEVIDLAGLGSLTSCQ